MIALLESQILNPFLWQRYNKRRAASVLQLSSFLASNCETLSIAVATNISVTVIIGNAITTIII
jgi:hypothetical protein